jgi:hypothetical protein
VKSGIAKNNDQLRVRSGCRWCIHRKPCSLVGMCEIKENSSGLQFLCNNFED